MRKQVQDLTTADVIVIGGRPYSIIKPLIGFNTNNITLVLFPLKGKNLSSVMLIVPRTLTLKVKPFSHDKHGI